MTDTQQTATLSLSTDPMVMAWASFLRYIRKHAPSPFARTEVRMLVRGRSPVAWRVTYSEMPLKVVDRPGDADRAWMSFIRHIIAMCHDNNGYALVSASVITNHKRPISWLQANVRKIYPMDITNTWGDEVVIQAYLPEYSAVN